MDLKISMDTSGVKPLLASLIEAAERFPEVRDGLLRFIDAGSKLFTLESDRAATSVTDELVVRMYPSDSLLSFVPAARAAQSDFLIVEHSPASVVVEADKITT